MERDFYFKDNFPGLPDAVRDEIEGCAQAAEISLQAYYDKEAEDYRVALLKDGPGQRIRFNGGYTRDLEILIGDILREGASREALEYSSCRIPIHLKTKILLNLETRKSFTFQGSLLLPRSHFLAPDATRIVKEVLAMMCDDETVTDSCGSFEMDARRFWRLAAATACKIGILAKEKKLFVAELEAFQGCFKDVLKKLSALPPSLPSGFLA